MRSGSSVNQRTTPCAYREDTGKKDQGHALLDGGSTPREPDEDDPTTMATVEGYNCVVEVVGVGWH
jgi:hypothetical protein